MEEMEQQEQPEELSEQVKQAQAEREKATKAHLLDLNAARIDFLDAESRMKAAERGTSESEKTHHYMITAFNHREGAAKRYNAAYQALIDLGYRVQFNDEIGKLEAR